MRLKELFVSKEDCEMLEGRDCRGVDMEFPITGAVSTVQQSLKMAQVSQVLMVCITNWYVK